METQKNVNDLAYKIVGCAIEVHRHLGPGLLESVYETCLFEELKRRRLKADKQVEVPILYKGKLLVNHLRIDMMVEDLIVLELKAVEQIIPLFQAQLLTYLKLCEKPKGLLINFNCVNIVKEGLIPMVNEQFALLPKE